MHDKQVVEVFSQVAHGLVQSSQILLLLYFPEGHEDTQVPRFRKANSAEESHDVQVDKSVSQVNQGKSQDFV